ncbi:hypothetical protein M0812_28928 [Anaeramoeba flamelloides]|uniref:Uncharacterized protein n=1 Tax=Anaeramoeba flamelloides TaxID=1746091 RepID=A0AAV7YD15_9EUKA|nr:hypothetical protein M0812_28928 [Anaeramoeba flamelloides]
MINPDDTNQPIIIDWGCAWKEYIKEENNNDNDEEENDDDDDYGDDDDYYKNDDNEIEEINNSIEKITLKEKKYFNRSSIWYQCFNNLIQFLNQKIN